MKIDHIAIWTDQLELMKDFYNRYFGGVPGSMYENRQKQFKSYFLTFGSGARIELMSAPHIPGNRNDTIELEHRGLIHIAFEVDSPTEVDEKARELLRAGCRILSGPRTTGDGSYEFATHDPDLNRLEVCAKRSE